MNSRLQEHEVTARNDAATARVGTSFLAPPPHDTRVSALRLRTLRMQSAQADFVLLLQRFQPPECEESIPHLNYIQQVQNIVPPIAPLSQASPNE